MKIQRDDPQFREKLERMLEPKTSLDYGMYADVEDIKELCPDVYDKYIRPYVPRDAVPKREADMLALMGALSRGMREHVDKLVFDSVADDEHSTPRVHIDNESLWDARDEAIRQAAWSRRMAKEAWDAYFAMADERDHLIKLLQKLEIVVSPQTERRKERPDSDPER